MIPFKKLEPLVFRILANHPDARLSDRKLMLRVWETQGFKLTPEQEALWLKCYKPESVRRIRQKINARGFFITTQSEIKRYELQKEHREYHKVTKDTESKWEEMGRKLKGAT